MREREKEEKEGVWDEKETERRLMTMCNPRALRIPFTVTDSCFDYEIQTRHQSQRIDIYLLNLSCRKRHVDAKSKAEKQSFLNG